MGGLDMAGNGAKDFVGGDVGPTVSKNFQSGTGQDDQGVIDFVGKGRTDLFGGRTDTTEQIADEGTPSSSYNGSVIDFPGKGETDSKYSNF